MCLLREQVKLAELAATNAGEIVTAKRHDLRDLLAGVISLD